MLKNNPTSPNSATHSTPDLLASHKTEQAQKSQQLLEEAIFNTIKDLENKSIESQKILEVGEVELKKTSEMLLKFELIKLIEGILRQRVSEILEKLHKKEQEVSLQFKAMTDNIEKLIQFSQESAITKVYPQKILKYIHSLPTYKQMSPEKEQLFLEIELALSNTSIIKAMPSEVIIFQLGVLGVEYQKNIISTTLFHNLTLMRVELLPDRFKLNEINGSLYKLSPLEMCQFADKYLSNKDRYNKSKKVFNQRMQGIVVELFQQNSLQRLHLQHLNGSLESIANPIDEKTEGTLIERLSNHQIPTESLPNLAVSEKPLYKTKGPNRYYYLLDEETINFMFQLLPEHKKYQFVIDEVSVCKLHELMQASLETHKQSDPLEEQFSSLRFIANTHKISSEIFHKSQEKMRSQYDTNHQYLASELVTSLTKLLTDYEESKKQNEACHLQGEELLTAYIEKMQRFIDNQSDRLDKKYFSEIENIKKERHFYQTKSPLEMEKKEHYQSEKKTHCIIKTNFNNLIKYAQLNLNKEIILGLKFPKQVDQFAPKASRALKGSNETPLTPYLSETVGKTGKFSFHKSYTAYREHGENTPVDGSYRTYTNNF